MLKLARLARGSPTSLFPLRSTLEMPPENDIIAITYSSYICSFLLNSFSNIFMHMFYLLKFYSQVFIPVFDCK